MLDAVDVCYFHGHLEDLGVEIRWMRARDQTSPSRLGQYWDHLKMVEISRVLAHAAIPDYYVQQVVYHEALHAIYGPDHGLEFSRAESRFLYTYECWKWERETGTNPWPAPPKGLR